MTACYLIFNHLNKLFMKNAKMYLCLLVIASMVGMWSCAKDVIRTDKTQLTALEPDSETLPFGFLEDAIEAYESILLDGEVLTELKDIELALGSTQVRLDADGKTFQMFSTEEKFSEFVDAHPEFEYLRKPSSEPQKAPVKVAPSYGVGDLQTILTADRSEFYPGANKSGGGAKNSSVPTMDNYSALDYEASHEDDELHVYFVYDERWYGDTYLVYEEIGGSLNTLSTNNPVHTMTELNPLPVYGNIIWSMYDLFYYGIYDWYWEYVSNGQIRINSYFTVPPDAPHGHTMTFYEGINGTGARSHLVIGVGQAKEVGLFLMFGTYMAQSFVTSWYY